MKEHLKRIWTGPEEGDPKPIIYFGGALDGSRHAILKHLKLIHYSCLSYFYLAAVKYGKGAVSRGLLEKIKANGTRCFLDSGAYTYQMQARKKNKPLTWKAAEVIIEEYAKWIYETDFVFDFIVTFDYERDPVTMWKATERLEARGLHPVPVYHLGVSIKTLHEIIARGYSLIGIGGLIPFNGARARPFLDQVFNVTEKHGVRCHGFGIGGPAMFEYPWFSVDSSAWMHLARIGKVYRASNDPRRLYETIPVSSKQTAVTAGLEDARDERIAINFRFLNQLMENSRKPVTRRKALF